MVYYCVVVIRLCALPARGGRQDVQPEMAKVPKAKAREQSWSEAARVLQITRLLGSHAQRPSAASASEGMAIGRAIVRFRRKCSCSDEPLSNLDAGLRVQMRVGLTMAAQGTRQHDDSRAGARSGREAMTVGRPHRVFNMATSSRWAHPLEFVPATGQCICCPGTWAARA